MQYDVEGKMLCPACARERTTHCIRCGERIMRDRSKCPLCPTRQPRPE
ncbi:hypothetical protein LJC63_07160 [Ruminococcaceae bacterium OttesenSCG-928-L11]|nr:hypothetical protein [Ruminococcaceae bacterium OttesenSCG-928-L11]